MVLPPTTSARPSPSYDISGEISTSPSAADCETIMPGGDGTLWPKGGPGLLHEVAMVGRQDAPSGVRGVHLAVIAILHWRKLALSRDLK